MMISGGRIFTIVRTFSSPIFYHSFLAPRPRLFLFARFDQNFFMREGIQVVGPVWTAASFVRLDLPGLFFRFWFRIVHREQRLHVFNHLDRFRFFAPSSKEHLLLLADDRFFLDLVVQLFNQFRLLLDLLGLFFNLFRQDSKNVLRIGCVVLCVVTIFQALTIPHSSKYFSHDPTRFSSGFDGVFLHDAQAVQKPAQLLFAQAMTSSGVLGH